MAFGVVRGNEPHGATRCGGRRGVPAPVTAREAMDVPFTAGEVEPVPTTAGDLDGIIGWCPLVAP